jgi:ATP-dependent protease ClpP protease subunit
MATVKERVKKAEELTNTDPTDGQKSGGNYKKGKFIIKGLKISVENPAGSTRSGISKDGKMWVNKMPFTYGYFRGTIGKDGDPIDVYLGPIIDKDFDVYIIDQVDEETRAFDEHKVMLGFESEDKAKEAYLSCFEDTWTGFNSITVLTLKKFKRWLYDKDAIKYPASKLSMSKKMKFKNEAMPRIKLIQLEGEVLDDQIQNGKLISEGTLAQLKKQAGEESEFDTLILEIASPGGSVSEGLMIMVWLDYLSQQGKEIITVVTANAYSIASLIMLAADHRMISKHGKVMVHNPMVPELKYANANELEKYASELRDLESVMYELYEIFTGLTTKQIKALMDNETYLDPTEAVQNGFADVVIDIEQKSFQMTINNKQEINMFKTLNILNRVIGMVNKTDFVNQLYYDNEGGEIEIFQNDPSTYATGDRTNVETGEVTLSDGSKLMIENFMITSIEKGIAEDVMPETEAAVEEPMEEIVEEILPVEEAIEAPMEEEAVAPTKGKDEMPATVIETTESVKTTKETVALETEEVKAAEFNEGPAPEKVAAEIEIEIEPEAPEEEVKMEEPVAENPKENVLYAIEILQEGFDFIKEQIGQLTEANTEMKAKFDAKFTDMAKFEEVATEAIDALASATTSNFKPEARTGEIKSPKGSIFNQMKKKRGL